MKAILFIACLLFTAYSYAEELNYTASTPANSTVRQFLGINQNDSIDFIRWNLKINDREFNLSCSYGIGKPNTNGFIDEKKVQLNGSVSYENETLRLNARNRSLSCHILNQNLLHILHQDNTMMIGNGGWSYTLNSKQEVHTTEVNPKVKDISFNDSVVFIGRTPCKHAAEMLYKENRSECYKMKWLLSLRKDSRTASSGSYRLGASGQIKGKWKMKENAEGRIIYQLDLNNGNTLEFVQIDENIIYIMDKEGGLLVGDHDFSYSLSRRK